MDTEKDIRPAHYRGPDDPYEAIKVIEALGLGFCDGNVLKYLCRWRQKGGMNDLRKARFNMDRFVQQQQQRALREMEKK